jgi:GNAT superfamily N-acetyltransferase
MVIMHDSISGPHPHGSWVKACEEVTVDRLANDPNFFAYVTETEESGVVSFVTAEVRRRFPGPSSPAPIYGYTLTGGTDPEHRRKGYMKACFVAILDRFVELGCDRVSLFSSQQLEKLLRELGFERHDDWPVPMNWYAPNA